jgi:hypothetical protein
LQFATRERDAEQRPRQAGNAAALHRDAGTNGSAARLKPALPL